MTSVMRLVYAGLDGELHTKKFYLETLIEMKLELMDENVDELLAMEAAQRLRTREEASG